MIKFYKLLNMLNRNELKKHDLERLAGISGPTVAKIAAHGNIKIETIDKICKALKCQPGDIMEYIEEKEEKELGPSS